MTLSVESPPGRSMADGGSRIRAWAGSAEKCAYGLIAFVYVLAVSGRPLVVTPESAYDDGLYLRLAGQIASGRWLGPYDQLTLAKEPGFPIFVALNYTVGLPFGLGVCLVYTAAAWFLCRVLRDVSVSVASRLILFAAILFAPPLASSITTFVERDFFYAGLCLALFAAVIDMGVTRRAKPRRWASAALAGLLAGWVWLTREEGIWFVPAVAAFAVLSIAQSPKGEIVGTVKRWALAVTLGLSAVLAVGVTNRIVYGRFELAEIKSGPFQSAMIALQRAAYPEWQAYVPVPAAARARIYGQSPSFKRLQPVLDPPGAPNGWQAIGCSAQPDTCGDFGGSYMMWALRAAASDLGLHSSPATADAFYAGLAREIGDACRDQRLACAPWMPPLIPPVTMDQVRAFPDTLLRTAERVAMTTEPDGGWIVLGPARDIDRGVVELIGGTPYGPGRIVTLSADIHGAAASTLTVTPGDTARIILFRPPTAGTSQFSLIVGCLAEPCTIRFGGADQADTPLPVAPTSTMDAIPSDSGLITNIVINTTEYSLKSRFGNFLNRSLPRLSKLYSIFIIAGAMCFSGWTIYHLCRRTLPLEFAIVLTLTIAVLTRIVVVALVDASSFPAINDAYLAPAFPLCITAALLSIDITAAAWRDRFWQVVRRRRDRPPRSGGRGGLRETL